MSFFNSIHVQHRGQRRLGWLSWTETVDRA